MEMLLYTGNDACVPIYVPRSEDVKCGKDRDYETNDGNQLLRTKIVDCERKYRQLRGYKHLTCSLITQIVTEMKDEFLTRFIRYNNETQCWFEISRNQAHAWVSRALRKYHMHNNPYLNQPSAEVFKSTKDVLPLYE
jgi:hypothetical protein